MLLSGFAFRGYRSVFNRLAVVAPLGKITLIAGQNNSGKSNVLRVAERLEKMRGKAPVDVVDVPRARPVCQFEMAVRVGSLVDVTNALSAELQVTHDGTLVRMVGDILGSAALNLQDDRSVWLRYSQQGAGAESIDFRPQAMALGDVYANITDFLNRRRDSISSDAAENALRILKHLEKCVTWPRVRLVQASRRISAALDGVVPAGAESLSGVGLIPRLAALQNPSYADDDDRERFAAINEFLQRVLEDETATLEVPHSMDELNVRRQGTVLPLANLGTGVTQVIVLAAAATLETNTLLCMEEPEVHLHPRLQRKLLRYLHDKTDNQYLIATHSAHLLDSEIASVFHVTYTEDGTAIDYAGTPAALSSVCYDLGYRPSDLLQTNCVIWVEGPSDRIYLAHWIWLAKPEIREGIDYSIMFYGGRLLSNLTAEDPEVTEFINLRRLNRHLAVVIDSDKSTTRAHINATKRRIRDEITSGDDPGLVWITGGRTIENYIPVGALTKILDKTHPGRKFESATEKWSNVTRPLDPSAKWQADKIKIAREVIRRWKGGLDYLDLHERIVALIKLIESANGRQPERGGKISKNTPTILDA